MTSSSEWNPSHHAFPPYRGGPPPPPRRGPPYYDSRAPPPMDHPHFGPMYGGGAPYDPPPPYMRDSSGHYPQPRYDYWRGGGNGGGSNDGGYGPPPPSTPSHRNGYFSPYAPARLERPPPGVTEEYPPSSWPQPPSGLVIRSKRSADEKDEKDASSTSNEKKDPLSLLAKVSSTMEDDNQNGEDCMEPPARKRPKSDQQRERVSTPPPENKVMKTVLPVQTSPIRGGPRVSPIVSPRSKRQEAATKPESIPHGHLAPKLITPTVSYHKEGIWDTGPGSVGGGGGGGGGFSRYTNPPHPHPSHHQRGPPPPQQQHQQQQHMQSYYSTPPTVAPGGPYRTAPAPPRNYHPHYHGEPSPALVEHSSFDSVESMEGRYSQYYEGYRSGGGPYPPADYGWWQSQSHQQHSSEPYTHSYPPPRWSYPPSGPYDGPPPPQHMMPRPQRYDEYAPPPSPRTNSYSPYAYVQQPHMESKTVLKKKFSWKNYPEVSCSVRVSFLVLSTFTHCFDC